MSMVNNIGGATLSAALVGEKAVEPKKIAANTVDNGTNANLDASVAAYLSLPGLNSTSPLQTDTSNTTNDEQAHALVKAVSEDGSLKQALQQFDEGLKKLVLRPETQAFQSKFAAANNTANADLPGPDPLPGVGKDGLLGAITPSEDLAADTNHDGKVSEDELRRYEQPLTYRSASRAVDAATNGPSAFSLSEVNSAYGAQAAAAATEAA